MNLHYQSAAPYTSQLTDDAFNRVENSLSRAQRGFSRDLVTPFIKDRLHTDDGRIERRSEMASSILSTGFHWLDEAELAQAAKIGSYSIMDPFYMRQTQVGSYFVRRELRPDHDAFEFAKEALASETDEGKLRAIDLDHAFNEMPKGTNLGLPWCTSEKEYLPQVLAEARRIKKDEFKEKFLWPCLLYWRGQPNGIGLPQKNRTVWGFSHIYTILELSVQVPVLERLRELPDYCAWVGSDYVNSVITNMLDESEQPILSVDFSGYDASVPGALIEAAFDVLLQWFRGKDHPLINYLKYVFLNVPLLTPYGVLQRTGGAIPSGSGVTNLIGGLVQKLAMYYVAYQMGNRVIRHLVQGDDGVVSFERPWDSWKVEHYMSQLGLTLHTDKGGVSRDRVYYLQNIHSSDYRIDGRTVGIRPLMRVLNGALSYERFKSKWNSYDDSIRWWQQFENASEHPKFREGVELLYKWDKHSRELNADQVLKRAGGLEAVESALNQTSFPYGKRPVSELSKFKVVKVLEELRSGPGTSQRKAWG